MRKERKCDVVIIFVELWFGYLSIDMLTPNRTPNY
jgi:hypothetical protein